MRRNHLQDLHRLDWAKRRDRSVPMTALGEEMLGFFNQTVRRRQTKLAKIAEAWAALVPQSLCDHCTLYSLTRGKLTVLVDSSVHLYELKQLLLAGLEDQLLLACKSSGLQKIGLKPGKPPEEPRDSRARRCSSRGS